LTARFLPRASLRLPTMQGAREYVEAASQMSYGSGERRQMIHNMKRNPVGFVRKGGTTILQHDDSKVGVGRVPGRRFDPRHSHPRRPGALKC
jgi:hypothetical protein